MQYPHLSSPGTIGSLELKNRFIMTAMGSNFAEEDGSVGKRLIGYCETRARGGTALMILETSSIAWPEACSMPNMLGLSEDRFLPGLRSLVERVHDHQCLIAAQLNHSGKVSQEDVVAGRPILVPSEPIKLGSDLMGRLTEEERGSFIRMAGPDGKGPRYHVMEPDDIARVISQFADAAQRCQRAGFDAVEVHAGHGYLIASFLSPASNRRADQYGGCTENRARFLVEVIRAIKECCGNDFPVLVRLDSREYRIDGGIEPDDFLLTAQLAEQAGADAIDVSAYGNPGIGVAFTEAPLAHQPDAYVELACLARQRVDIPIMAVGRIELDSAEKHVAQDNYQFLGLGRKILADPDLPRKVVENRSSEIRPCIYCYICVSQIFINQPMMCAVNADMGHEYNQASYYSETHSTSPRHVVVVGGGPGGMEAARRCAEAGHRVTLLEKMRDLGGTARIAALAYEPNGRLIDWLENEVRRLAVDIRRATAVDSQLLEALKPDHVIVATGARREAPPIPGKNAPHVFDGEEMRALLLGGNSTATRKLTPLQRLMVWFGQTFGATRSISLVRAFSRLWMPVGHRVVVVGGGLVGVELAEFLVERGRLVTLLSPETAPGPELSIVRRVRVLQELEDHGCNIERGVQDIRCDQLGVHYTAHDSKLFAAADTIILALGAEGNLSIAEEIAALGYPTSTVGDCERVGYIDGAIHSAREVTDRLLDGWTGSFI